MKHNKRAAALITAITLALTMLFTACPNNAGGSGGGTPTLPSYVQVPYGELETYLRDTASTTEVNYIEVTGTIPKDDFKGTNANTPGALGKKLKDNLSKKVALKIETYPSDLVDMSHCFSKCANLVSLANLPASGITNMASCFVSCAELTAVPDIPAGVTDISGCFAGCKKLSIAPKIPESVTNMYRCFNNCESLIAGPDIPANVESMTWCFKNCSKLTGVKLLCDYNPNQNHDNSNKAFAQTFIGCTALTDGSIKVQGAYYKNYTNSTALTTMSVPGADTAAQEAKFEAVWKKVKYENLAYYLANTASATGVNSIEVTGAIPKEDFKGKDEGVPTPGALGKKLQDNPSKKVALKIEAYPSDLVDMSYCFSKCENLILLADLPTSNITHMTRCFIDCKNLTACPDIPASVDNMASCFNRCEKLTGVKLKCNYTSTGLRFAFNGCTALKDGGIKVRTSHYANYTAPPALNNMQVPGADTAAQKAKFAPYNP